MKIDIVGLKKFVGNTFAEDMVETPEGVLNYLIGDPRTRLYSFVATSNLKKDKFYMSKSDVIDEIKKNIAAVILQNGNYEMNVKWLCQLAVFARHNLYMRTIGLVIITQLLHWVSDCKMIEDAIYHVVNRPDEIVKLVTMYVDGDKSKPLDNILKRGLARTYFKFDAYQFAKYKNTKCPVTGFTISKLMAMVHPKDGKLGVVESLLKQVRHNRLPEPYTWEVELSKAGIESNRESFVEDWFIENVFDYYKVPEDMWTFSVCQAKKFLRECRLGNVKVISPYNGNILTDFRKALKEHSNNLGDRKAKMEELIDSGRLPYQASLMNLRSFLEMGVDDAHIKRVCDILERNIAKSKLQPFNFLSAWKAVNNFTRDSYNVYRHWGEYKNSEVDETATPIIEYINSALEKCIIASYNNVELFKDFGKECLFACDVSGSMMDEATPTITFFDIGLIMGMVAYKNASMSDLGIFGDTFAIKNSVVANPDTTIFDKFKIFIKNEGEVGYATNGWKVLDHAIKSEKKYDMVMMFTDCQMYDSERFCKNDNVKIGKLWKNYKKNNPSAKLILFNLNSYGNTAIETAQDDVYMVSGWNNEIFNCLHNLMNTGNGLEAISKVEL